jgi:hypothetical protein
MYNKPPSQRNDLNGLLGLLLALLFASPLMDWWANSASAWYLVYLFWAIIITLAAYLVHHHDDHEP